MLLCILGMTPLDQQHLVLMYSEVHLKIAWRDQGSESLEGVEAVGVEQASL